MNALQHLNTLAHQRKAERSTNFPAKYIPKSSYNDRDANGLTRCIVDYLNLSGHFATRLASTGTYRADLQKFVGSQQRASLPDVFAVVNGSALFVEVKVENDRLSDVQKQTITGLNKAGASVYVARDFQGFYDWFTALWPMLADADALPFGPTPNPYECYPVCCPLLRRLSAFGSTQKVSVPPTQALIEKTKTGRCTHRTDPFKPFLS